MPGPLSGIRVIELAAIGPVPFCGMLFADMGADVIRIDRADGYEPLGGLVDVCGRGKKSVGIDLKSEAGIGVVLQLAESADVLIEGFRPGVAERLGLGPKDLETVNPRLVYGRMTGWGQDGPLAATAGHDINYISLTGTLHAIGTETPTPPLNLVGDYGGGALYLAMGVLAALHERAESGRGQVVDAAMIDGAASLMTPTYQLVAAGMWADQRAANVLDGAAPFYRVYATADGGHMAVGALEPQFYAELLRLLMIDPQELPAQYDRAGWPEIAARFTAEFARETRDHWESVFSGSDACVSPVLSLLESASHPHNQTRSTFLFDSEFPMPAPAPRFSRTPAELSRPERSGTDVLTELGMDETDIVRMVDAGVIAGGSR